MLNWNLHSFQPLEIIQMLGSISWVRCASVNVFIDGVGDDVDGVDDVDGGDGGIDGWGLGFD